MDKKTDVEGYGEISISKKVSARGEAMIDFTSNAVISDFRQSLKDEFGEYLSTAQEGLDYENCLKIDFHCHDHNSDVPDELWGRILGLPETWLKTDNLVKCLHKNDCDVVTITNHNNARSCWELIDEGKDVLVGTEFTCYFPEYNLFVHVLAYGFNAEQEKHLNKTRENIYQFLKFAAAQNIPVILPHPLYLYTRDNNIDQALFEKLAVIFQRYEVLNGQRDLWQSVLTLNWVKTLTPEKINLYAEKHGLTPSDFAVDPDKPKVLTGGSDDHMGVFAGECGSYLYVPNLAQRLKTEKPSALALEALIEGRVVPFGYVEENQKLNIALLDYFVQAAVKIEDPGLLRLFFHRGEASDKVACFIIANLLLELKKSKNAQSFFKFIHKALQGKKPGKLLTWKVKKDYKFCIEHLTRIADSKGGSPNFFVNTVNSSVQVLYKKLSLLIVQRLKTSSVGSGKQLSSFSTADLTSKFEIPSQLTALFYKDKPQQDSISNINIGELLDHLSFPMLVSMVLFSATFASTRLLYQNRSFLNDFSERLGCNQHPKRALYLTDTLRDKNGVSNSLSAKLKEIQQSDLPIDFLVCSTDIEEEAHLYVVEPITTFSVGKFGEQELRVPDFLEVAKVFYEGGYDRIVCSTEGPMALVALVLKHMFNVPAFFFMHTDWVEFIKNTTDLTQHELDRVRRALRFFYKQFEGVFVLNTEHQSWLTGHHMQLEESRVHLTAHHVGKFDDMQVMPLRKGELFNDANSETPVLLFASRLSKEKGIFDLPFIYQELKKRMPDIRFVIAGSGPDEDELKAQMPEANFLGWVDKQTMAAAYAGLDLKVFPSRFDTFGNVVLEAFTQGMPVIAYNTKGPKDIIEDGINGFLVEDKQQMVEQIEQFFSSNVNKAAMRENALNRCQQYQAEPIMAEFMTNLGLND
ncbi:glycosyltransferase [Cycloclasticus pugetii]|uniref:glycosyltransferase n=1 Tax=Cycloclasticus pugetii TaxID=34068 RepID=UPI001C6FCB82|nr:glycosyltransferase [Cycloclasticus pugetii]